MVLPIERLLLVSYFLTFQHISMRKNYKDIRQTDLYQKVYATHQDLKESERLRNKFSEKPYRIRFRLLRNLSLGTSLIANLLSAATASIAVYFFLNEMLHHVFASGALTVLLLFILELAKRTTGKTLLVDLNRKGKNGFSLLHLLILLSLTTTSIALSYNGGKRTAQQFIEEPDLLIEENYSKTYVEALAKIDQQIDDARQTTYRGITTTTSQRTIEALTKQRSEIQDKLFDTRKRVENTNNKIKAEFKVDRASKGQLFALITIFVEFLFLCCLFYVEYYDYKSYIELPENDKPELFGIAPGPLDLETPSSREDLEDLLQEVVEEQLKAVVLPLKEELTQLAATTKETADKVGKQSFLQEIQAKEASPQKTSYTPVSNMKTAPIVEQQKVQKIELIELNPTEKKVKPTNSKEREALKKQIRTKKNGISKAKGRLNRGEGNPETHTKNIDQWTLEVSQLQKALIDLDAADESRQH